MSEREEALCKALDDCRKWIRASIVRSNSAVSAAQAVTYGAVNVLWNADDALDAPAGAPGRAAPEPPEDHASFEEARAAGFPALRRSLEKRRRLLEGVSGPEQGAADGPPWKAIRAIMVPDNGARPFALPGSALCEEDECEGYEGKCGCRAIATALRAALRSAPKDQKPIDNSGQ